MNVEWSESKRFANINKHGVDFIDAALIFENPVIESVDVEYFMVIYTWRGDARRIISAWKVGENGKRRYKKILSKRA